MDKEVILVEMPKLSDEAAIHLYDFLQAAALAFESHYYTQIRSYYQQYSLNKDAEEDPF